MKKAIIPAALLLSLAGAANAQLAIYGLLDGSYGKSVADNAADKKADFHSGGDDGSGQGNSTSRFGLKGSTDVGSGFKANFKLESAGITSDGHVGGTTTTVDSTTGAVTSVTTTPFFNRQAWFGLSGGFGEVRFGRQDSIPFQSMIDYDFNGASNGVSSFAYAGAAIWGLDGRQSRSLQYISPVFSGVKVQLGFVPEGNVVGAKNTFSGAATFATGPLSVTASFETKRTETDERFASVAGSYDFGVAKVMLGYADGGKESKTRGFNVGFTAPVAGANIGALVAKNRDTKGVAYEFFANKEVLKNTIVYAEVGRADAKAVSALPFNPPIDKAATGYALGLIYIF